MKIYVCGWLLADVIDIYRKCLIDDVLEGEIGRDLSAEIKSLILKMLFHFLFLLAPLLLHFPVVSRLAFFELNYQFHTTSELQSEVIRHYSKQVCGTLFHRDRVLQTLEFVCLHLCRAGLTIRK